MNCTVPELMAMVAASIRKKLAVPSAAGDGKLTYQQFGKKVYYIWTVMVTVL
jgi:hypothetical protein